MRQLVLTYLSLFSLLFSTASYAAQPIVLELFTSQGCSSCPPADRTFGEIIEDNPDIIALSFHVDYWDRLGWKDPHSLPESTTRQKNYADAMGSSKLFTPQVMLNGQVSYIGTKHRSIQRGIEDARDADTPFLPVSLVKANDGMRVVVLPEPEGKIRGDANIWYVAYEKGSSTRVKRGGNWGKTIRNHHSVTQLLYLGKWNENHLSLELDFLPEMGHAAIVVQRPDGGRIIGGVKLEM